MTTRRYVGILLCFIAAFTQNARGNDILDSLVDSYVVNLDDFTRRFNGTQHSITADSISRGQDIAQLFDLEYVKSSDQDSITALASSFIDTVIVDNVRLSLLDKRNTINALCTFEFDGAPVDLELLFNIVESSPDTYRLVLSGVDGLELIIEPDTTGVSYTLSPFDYEMKFIDFGSLIKNNPKAISTLLTDGIDTATYLVALIEIGKIKYVECRDVVAHFRQVRGFEFDVKECTRFESSNAGWLITKLSRL